jgi:glycosyltransferase involved in cell wall biosynthesis
MTADAHCFDVVVPTVGRASLVRLLEALDASDGPRPQRVVLVDDRPDARRALVADADVPLGLSDRLQVVLGGGRGPAAARNAGWRAGSAPWVAFLDDDVVPSVGWLAGLARDLDVEPAVWGSQGALRVPLPADRPPTDWERQVAGLADARWATADMAYRRAALELVGGFDERFPRAYREDADLALRVLRAGGRLARGRRVAVHPIAPAPTLVSVRRQVGNRDDVRMWRLHGPGWREAVGAPPGRAPRHALTAGLMLLAGAALLGGRRRLGAVAALAWAGATAEFALARVRPGPRTARETAAMATTSVAIPPLATAQRAAALAATFVPRSRP